MSQKIYSNLDIKGNAKIGDITNATSDTDKFLVSDAGVVKYRTGAEMLSDLGVTAGTANHVQHSVKASVAINKGQAVYVTDADGTNMIVGLASNAAEATSSKTMGLLNATVGINGFADVITEGLLSGLNTSTAVVGNPVWLGTGGNLIYGLANKPYAPAHLVFIGIVTRVNANNGEIFVKVQNGFELEELHNVDLQTTAPSNNDILSYEGGTVNLWKNKTIPAVLGYTPYNASNPNGYISSYTETDPTVPSHVKSITTTEKSNWNTAYGWGNHASAGYLTTSLAASTYASLTGSYSNPSWITGLAWSKIIGAPAFITSYTETDTLATVTSRGATTSYGVGFNNYVNILNQNSVYWYNTGNGSYARTYYDGSTFNLDKPLWVTASVYGDVFYDRNNSAYYIDPASTSNLYALTVNQTISGNISGSASTASNLSGGINSSTSGISSMKVNDTRYWVTDPNAPGNYFQALTMGNGSDFTQIGVNSSNQMYYRFNGTGSTWYTVLSSNNYTSFSPSLTGSGASGTWGVNITGNAATATQIYQDNEPTAGTYRLMLGNASDTTGYIYNFNSLYYNSNTATIQGANISGTAGGVAWTNVSGRPTNVSSFTNDAGYVNVAANRWYDGWVTNPGYDANTIGGSKSGFTYANNAPLNGTLVHFDSGGYGLQLNSNYTTGVCEVSFRSRQGDMGVWGTWGRFLSSANYSGYSNFSGAVYGTIFYDSNNTGYYCDPSSTSRMVASNIDTMSSYYGMFNTQDVSVNSTYGVYWQPNASTDYGIYKAAGAWTQPLHINFYTGIRLRSHQSYGGTQFYNVSSGNTVMGVANGNDAVSVYTDMRSPIYYDYNDTAYYINPADADVSAVLKGTVTIGGGTGGNYDEGLRIIDSGSFSVITFGATGNAGPGRYQWLKNSSDVLELRNVNGSQIWWANQNGDVVTNYISYAGSSSRAPIFYDSNNTGYYVDPASTTQLNVLNTANAVNATYLGVQNTSSTSGIGISLYNNAATGQPQYGLMFAGTATFGTFGSVTADWATYFTMDSTANRGWIFRDTVNGNKASISNGGVATFAGDVVAYGSSDKELKDNITPIENALEKVKQIGGYSFDWNDKQDTYTGHDVGVIAQEIEAVLPEVVTTRDTGFKAVKYEKIVPLLIECIKEQQTQIEELKELVNQLINK